MREGIENMAEDKAENAEEKAPQPKWKERYLQLWNKYSKKQKYIFFGIVLAILIAIVGVGAWYGSKPDMVPLFTNMEAKDAGEVAAKLKEDKVNYEVQENKQGTTILVPSDKVHETRLSLATEGLPRGQKGFEIFDDSKLGVTEFQNKVNYLQALQGELTRTIEQIDAVQKARVHIVLPEDSLYKKNEKPATASIMLMLKPNQELQKKEIKGIVNLAAHSIQGLQPENITIVDETGKILNDPDELDEKSVGAKTMTQLEMTKKVQDNIQKNVQSLLDQAPSARAVLSHASASSSTSTTRRRTRRRSRRSSTTPASSAASRTATRRIPAPRRIRAVRPASSRMSRAMSPRTARRMPTTRKRNRRRTTKSTRKRRRSSLRRAPSSVSTSPCSSMTMSMRRSRTASCVP